MANLARRWLELARQLDTVPDPSQGPVLAPVVLPVMDLPEVGKRAAGTAAAGAEAALRSSVQIWNPLNSGMVIHVTRIWLHQSVAGTAQLKLSATELANLGTATELLDRRKPRGDPAGEVRQDALAATGAIFAGIRVPTINVNHEIKDLDVILPEAQSLMVAPDADNVTMTATFWWFEAPNI